LDKPKNQIRVLKRFIGLLPLIGQVGLIGGIENGDFCYVITFHALRASGL
jgi:hypothetical protein